MTPHFEPGELVWIYPPGKERYGAIIGGFRVLLKKGQKSINAMGNFCVMPFDHWYYTLEGDDPDNLYAERIIRKRPQIGDYPFDELLARLKTPCAS